MEESSGPVRTCLSCRGRMAQRELWRFAADEAGIVVQDFDGRRGGRHVYCCRKADCLARFLKNKKRLSGSFRQQVLGFDEELKNLFGSGA